MLKARRGNREYTIGEQQMEAFNKRGFEIVEIDDDGEVEVVLHNPGKVVPYAQYEALEAKAAELEATVEELEAKTAEPEFEYAELKILAAKLNLEFAGNISRVNLVALLKENAKSTE